MTGLRGWLAKFFGSEVDEATEETGPSHETPSALPTQQAWEATNLSPRVALACDCGTRYEAELTSLVAGAILFCPTCGDRTEIDAATADRVQLEARDRVQKLNEGLASAKWGKTYAIGIVGESNYQDAISRCREGEPVKLLHQPDNPYDDRAIVVRCARGQTIGYVPRDSFVHEAMIAEGKATRARIRSMEAGGPGMIGVVVELEMITQTELKRITGQ